jgi:ubiquinone/menaquinone biosynthesis C-methylase UbiE
VSVLTRIPNAIVKKYYIKVERYDWVDVADHFKGVEAIFHRNRERVMKKTIKKYSQPGRLLDVGCGTGLILRNMPPGAVGLDINPWNAKKAKSYVPRSGGVVVGDAEKMPFKNRAFSTVVCAEVLEHLPNPEMAIYEVDRVLDDRGVLIGSVPRRSFLWKLRALSSTCPKLEPFHRLYSTSEVRRLISRFRLVKNEISSFGLNILFIAKKL